jgi:Ca2+-transporting ATPase
MAGLIDPPRQEALDAIRECRAAGIKAIMITGDQPLTAKAIADKLEILDAPEQKVISGAELMKMPEEDLFRDVSSIRVYARVSPEQKLSIIRALQHHGAFVSMTGDGVNDAPSLKQADIGVAMGITGTDVSKEAASMILLDDNFATIVKAVREGRRIYDNIRKFIQYVLSCNMAELLTIFVATLLAMPAPLLPTHILWINLVTDGLPGIALASEGAERDVMKRPPRPHNTGIFDRPMVWSVCVSGIILAAGSVITQQIAIRDGDSLPTQQTMVFTYLCFAQLLNALSVRTGRRPLLHRFFGNPFLLITVVATVLLQLALIYLPFANEVLKTVPLGAAALLQVAGASLGSIVLVELSKQLYVRFADKAGKPRAAS